MQVLLEAMDAFFVNNMFLLITCFQYAKLSEKYKGHSSIPAIPQKYKIMNKIPENATTIKIPKIQNKKKHITTIIIPKR